MLKHRIITAVTLIPIVIFVIFAPDVQWFSLLFGLFIVIGAWEWGILCRLSGKSSGLYSLVVVLILAGLYRLNDNTVYSGLILAGVLYWVFAVFLVLFYPLQRRLFAKPPYFFLIAGLFLFIPMWSSLILLKFSTHGASLLMLLMLLIWGADTAAYFVGKKWGRRKLAVRISPGKTWEGTFAGVLTGVVIGLYYAMVVDMPIDNQWVFIGLLTVTAAVSVFGDLMESLMKRQASKKDSGTLLRGHGGVMDRIDSLTAAAPVYALGVIYQGALA